MFFKRNPDYFTTRTWADCFNPCLRTRFYSVSYSNSRNSGITKYFWTKYFAKKFMKEIKNEYEYIEGIHSITGNYIQI